MNSEDLAYSPALEQARLIRTGELSPLELTEVCLERIDRLDSQFNSFFLVLADQAREEAKRKTEELATRGAGADALPPFFGVPISVKDLTPVAGVPCTYGLHILRDRIANVDAGVVQRAREAGFTILGKTATSQIGSSPFTEPRGFPPTRNPWNPDYTPGGSSGGAAAALSAGFCSAALATDGGGSIRGPAYCCGLVGIKPARGRVSSAPLGERMSGLAIDGPLARTVADAAALLDVMSGYIPGDPYFLPDPPATFLEATQKPLGSLRIGMIHEITPVGTVDAVGKAAIDQMAQRLEALGHRVEPHTVDFSTLIEPMITVWQAGVDMGVPWIFLDKLNRWLRGRSRRKSGGDYLRALMKIQPAARELAIKLSAYDAILMPVYLHHTIRVGEWRRLSAPNMFEKVLNWVAPSPPINATGQPAIALPTQLAPDGLPTGVQLVGRPADEVTLIALAAQLEEAYPWSHRAAINNGGQ
ncbi:amidase [Vacuolonema iberomarrocanum]|uniref:amidase n=1 Tax=Vacuolonema iberomarrocanum TaxID=3454632 RepID=UPI0019E422F2|nr:amidase [filamentous cyanobacterium LEGE 07170]